MSDMDRYEDCRSCAFREGHEVCDMCEDADQWEWDEGSEDEEDFSGGYYSKKVIRFKKKKIKEVA